MVSNNEPEVSIIIPVYNEENRLQCSLIKIQDFLKDQPYTYEIFIVDDGSTDNTLSTIKEICNDDTRIKISSYGGNRGKGYAVRFGMINSRGKYRLFTDADLSTPIEEMTSLLERLDQGYNICIGSRATPDSQIIEHQPFYREFLGITYNRIIRITMALPFFDTQCGFKCVKGDVASRLFPLLKVDGFGFDVEMLFVAKRLGYTIKENGVRWINSPATKVSMLRDPVNMLATILKVYYHSWTGSYKEASE